MSKTVFKTPKILAMRIFGDLGFLIDCCSFLYNNSLNFVGAS